MQPYELPDFSLPYPARLNPHLDIARAYTKAWARQREMLGAPLIIWDEAQFDTMDFASLCAYTHPDAPSHELDLVTDWYVWVIYFDDHFLEACQRGHDQAGAKEYLDRLPAFMPVSLSDTARITKPRRVPVEIFHTRSLGALENSAVNYARFTNDVVSNQKEIEFEGELHDMVLITQKFLSASVILNDLYSKGKEVAEDVDLPKVIAAEGNCSPPESIERSAQIHNELMHTFVEEATLLTQLGSPALRHLLADIWGWFGGKREWHTERYHGASKA